MPSPIVDRIELPGRLVNDYLRLVTEAFYSQDKELIDGIQKQISELLRQMTEIGWPLLKPEFVAALQNENLRIRIAAGWFLLDLDTTRDEQGLAVDVLLEGLRAGLHPERCFIVVRLSVSCVSPKKLHREFKLMLEDEDPILRHSAATLLIQSPRWASKAALILSESLRSEDLQLAVGAARSLGNEGIRIEESVQCLLRILEDGGKLLQIEAAMALGMIGCEAEAVIPELINFVSDRENDGSVRAHIAHVIAKIQRSEIVQVTLTDLLDDDNWEVFLYATLGLVDDLKLPISESAFCRLLEMLEHSNAKYRGIAARCISEVPEQAKQAVPHLISRLMIETEETVCRMLIEGLTAAGKTAVPLLIETLRSATIRSMPLITMALNSIPEMPTEELVSLMLYDSDPIVQEAGTWILLAMGPKAVGMLPEILKILEDGNSDQRKHAIIAIATIGPEGIAATPHLVKALDNDDEDLSAWAEKGLIAMGGRVRPQLEESLTNSSKPVSERLQSIIDRLPPVTGELTNNEYDWISDRRLLRVFLLAGKLIQEHGGLSYRKLETLFAKLKEAGDISDDIKTSANFIRTSIKKLEQLLEKQFDREHLLVSRDTKSKTQLTEVGKDVLEKVEQYLKSKQESESS